jgi:hypothetical protein
VKQLTLPFIGAGAAALAFSLVVGSVDPATVAAAGPQSRGGTAACTTCATAAAVASTTKLTTAQAADLAAMAEEEKVARDLYRAFAARYPSPVWDNIAAAEASHLAAVRTLLTRYGIADPTAGRAEGSFASTAAAAMYEKLLAHGSASEVAAFGVGRTVELDDIAKLDAAVARATQPDVRQVYTNLRRGSVQHLRAFERQLAR